MESGLPIDVLPIDGMLELSLGERKFRLERGIAGTRNRPQTLRISTVPSIKHLTSSFISEIQLLSAYPFSTLGTAHQEHSLGGLSHKSRN